jgi:hypothetical protein
LLQNQTTLTNPLPSLLHTHADSTVNLDKQLSKLTRQTASTFAPRASGKTKNPAVKGSVLYNVSEQQQQQQQQQLQYTSRAGLLMRGV